MLPTPLSDVGKKNLISQFLYDDEDAHRRIISGIGVDFEMKTITVDGKRVKLYTNLGRSRSGKISVNDTILQRNKRHSSIL